MTRRTQIRALPALPALPALTSLGPAPVHAQSLAFPSKPIRYIVPVLAGGGSDLVGLGAERWSRLLGQPFVVDNIGRWWPAGVAGHHPSGYTLRDGRRVRVLVEHAVGSLQRSLSDAALDAKSRSMSDAMTGADRNSGLTAAC